VSGTYAEWVEQEVLPRVEQNAHVVLTKDPDGRSRRLPTVCMTGPRPTRTWRAFSPPRVTTTSSCSPA
jgi:hypothetical protein